MGYLSNTLADDEKVILHARPHAKTLIKPIAVLVLISALAGGIIFAITLLTGPAVVILGGIVGVAWLVGAILWFFAPLVRWATTHFAITDRRLLYRHGVVTKTGIDIPIARINSVQFRHDLVDRMFRTGTLIVESASDEPLEFNDIPNVEKVHALLYSELNEILKDDDR